jgi:hypothetical protein
MVPFASDQHAVVRAIKSARLISDDGFGDQLLSRQKVVASGSILTSPVTKVADFARLISPLRPYPGCGIAFHDPIEQRNDALVERSSRRMTIWSTTVAPRSVDQII